MNARKRKSNTTHTPTITIYKRVNNDISGGLFMRTSGQLTCSVFFHYLVLCPAPFCSCTFLPTGSTCPPMPLRLVHDLSAVGVPAHVAAGDYHAGYTKLCIRLQLYFVKKNLTSLERRTKKHKNNNMKLHVNNLGKGGRGGDYRHWLTPK